MLQWALLN